MALSLEISISINLLSVSALVMLKSVSYILLADDMVTKSIPHQ
jgi:hypothetical protein